MKTGLTALAAGLTLGLAMAGPAAAADTCANAAFRTGASADLPDCRAYEQISPLDKSGNDALSTGPVLSFGDRVFFSSAGSINNAESLPFDASYLASRGADWTTMGTDAPLDAASFLQRDTFSVSDDGTKAVVISQRAYAPGANDGGSNIYIRDLTQPRSYRLAVTSPSRRLSDNLTDLVAQGRYIGANGDLSAFAFLSNAPLTPGVPDDGQQYLYLWHDGNLSLASVLPGGTPISVAAQNGTNRPANNVPAKTYRLLSDDGTRLLFKPNFGQNDDNLYQYVEGQGSTLITQPQGQASPSNAVAVESFVGSPDGRSVTFNSTAQLTDDAVDNRGGIYRWSADAPANAPLTLVAENDGLGPAQVSPDGRFIWTAGNYLFPGAQNAVGVLRVIDTETDTTQPVAVLERELSGPAALSLSSDGSRAVFRSQSPVTGVDNTNAACKGDGGNNDGFCANLFTYDAKNPSEPVRCISCVPGAEAIGGANFDRSATFADGRESRPIFNDGRIFFDTYDRLVSGDVNSKLDVYEYVPGTGSRLITSGRSSENSTFRDTSPDGKDVLLVTADKLVPQDSDALSDVYTARVGGGIASQQVFPPDPNAGCTGAACRPGTATRPSQATPGSATLSPARPAAAARFTVARFSAATLRAAGRRGRLTVPVKVNRAGRVTATLRGRIGGRTRTAGTAAVRVSKTGTVRLTVRLSKAARAALKRDGKLRLALTVRYSEVGRASTRTLTLTTGRTASKAKGGAR